MKWLILEDEDCIHVVPESDIKPHGFPKGNSAELADADCPCKPELDFSRDKPMVTHNSFRDAEKIKNSLAKII